MPSLHRSLNKICVCPYRNVHKVANRLLSYDRFNLFISSMGHLYILMELYSLACKKKFRPKFDFFHWSVLTGHRHFLLNYLLTSRCYEKGDNSLLNITSLDVLSGRGLFVDQENIGYIRIVYPADHLLDHQAVNMANMLTSLFINQT